MSRDANVRCTESTLVDFLQALSQTRALEEATDTIFPITATTRPSSIGNGKRTHHHVAPHILHDAQHVIQGGARRDMRYRPHPQLADLHGQGNTSGPLLAWCESTRENLTCDWSEQYVSLNLVMVPSTATVFSQHICKGGLGRHAVRTCRLSDGLTVAKSRVSSTPIMHVLHADGQPAASARHQACNSSTHPCAQASHSARSAQQDTRRQPQLTCGRVPLTVIYLSSALNTH